MLPTKYHESKTEEAQPSRAFMVHKAAQSSVQPIVWRLKQVPEH